ncbi:MAG: D-alanyl-D-alanine carboxypeptidase [Lachnospiraceae bacterium]|nr:D-alanyl-D-alanine carboxypeptidase [Lachnospiraceae bacterium]
MSNINYTDEEIQQLHRARIERMRIEKRRQEEQRQKMKKFLPIVGSGICLLILAVVLIVAFACKSNDEAARVQPQQVNMEMEESVEDNSEDMEQTARSAIPQPLTGKEFDGTDSLGDVIIVASTEPESEPEQEALPPIQFAETDDTAYIYAEEVMSTNAILIREDTNEIAAVKGAYERISPASMTKVLTVLVAAEHISADELDNPFTMTLDITDYAYVNDCSSVGFLENEVVTLRDLFYGTVLPSGGDAAVGLATYVAGSHEAFVDMMNAKLEELGLSKTAHFTNCVGLYDEDHYCTVYDMAVIMKAAVQNEMCREFLSFHTYTTTATEQHPEGIMISNWFLRKIEDKDTGGEVICAKTGYVTESGSCAVSYATCADGNPYICVTTGAHSGWRCIYDHVEIYNRYVQKHSE